MKKDFNEWKLIYDTYIQDNLSVRELAEKFNKSYSMIKRRFKEYNFPSKSIDQINAGRDRLCMEKWGCKNPSQHREINEKKRNTFLSNYGDAKSDKRAEMYNKRKQTILERYGHEYVMHNEAVKEKYIKTCLDKYGCAHPTKSDVVKEKTKQTNLERYGKVTFLKTEEFLDANRGKKISEEVINKRRQTNLERYGHTCTLQSDLAREKAKQTNLIKYGCEIPARSEEVKQKTQRTNLQRYGHKSVLQHEETKNKIKQTNLARYGCESPLLNDEVQNKIKITNINKYGVENPFSSEAVIKNLRTKSRDKERVRFNLFLQFKNLTCNDEFIGSHHSHEGKHIGWVKYNFVCNTCEQEFSSRILSGIQCPFCNPTPLSQGEEKIKDILEECSILYKKDRTVISPQELDVYIPEKKIAFEYNGNYWHRCSKVGKNFHKNKTKECLNNNIKLYHIWEYNDERKIKSLIYSILGQTQHKYHARKLKVASLDHSQRRQFFDINHLHNDVKATFALGLVNDQNEIIQAISFRKNKGDLEIARFATKLNCQVRGGFSKLMKHSLNHIKENYPDTRKIITYCDRDWTPDYQDSVYYKYGFTLVGDSGPMLKYYNKGEITGRERFQKHKLKDMFEDYDGSNVNDFLETKHIYAFYNSGNWKFELNT